ncbi:hypothetical protein GGX14DRAFT_386861 [Mycena pura]|uniref:Uncharacterized protein n=1 Tax=Mycena pura TaxID=153505 RepID=A0AAD6YMK0_9AGAR|nr:hypothetical protein GGX14DRAFT_386861 [Mycena pura]
MCFLRKCTGNPGSPASARRASGEEMPSLMLKPFSGLLAHAGAPIAIDLVALGTHRRPDPGAHAVEVGRQVVMVTRIRLVFRRVVVSRASGTSCVCFWDKARTLPRTLSFGAATFLGVADVLGAMPVDAGAVALADAGHALVAISLRGLRHSLRMLTSRMVVCCSNGSPVAAGGVGSGVNRRREARNAACEAWRPHDVLLHFYQRILQRFQAMFVPNLGI